MVYIVCRNQNLKAKKDPFKTNFLLTYILMLIFQLDEEKTETRVKRRVKRQEDEEGGGLADLGICFGDILPSIREKYPNQKIVISIHTTQAPSVVLSSRNGGEQICFYLVKRAYCF
jgi:hypothetical protein